MTEELNFDVSTGLKRVLGSELITDDEVAIFEMVKNSFDANATTVHLYFDDDRIVVADDGCGMSLDDIREKWLFVAYSEKRHINPKSYRDVVASRNYLAGSKGIGRFSADRLGSTVALQTRPKNKNRVHRIEVDWDLFEEDDQEHFDQIPVEYSYTNSFSSPAAMRRFVENLSNGTIIEIGGLRHPWSRKALLSLRQDLAKLINPFGADKDKFAIFLHAPSEKKADKEESKAASKDGDQASPRDKVNGRIGNFIFSDLQKKTTFLRVKIENEVIESELVDRGETVYKIREPNKYANLEDSGFQLACPHYLYS